VIEICIIGAGPRGLSVLERLCANADESDWKEQYVKLHVVDPRVMEGGAVWRTSQAQELLMNTVASQITMFVDDSVACIGPVVPGPTLYDWARFIEHFDPAEKVPAWVRRECCELEADSYPSRALYGHYLQWVLRRLLRTAPANLEINLYPRTAVSLSNGDGGTQLVVLSDGTVLADLGAVILAQGHVPSMRTEMESMIADYAKEHGLNYVPSTNPADINLDFLAPGQSVALRGMGLSFFDYMTLLTAGRGGEFTYERDGRLIYQRSGNEPCLIVGSRRGLPYHARGQNQKGAFGRHEPLFLTSKVIASMRQSADRGHPVNFRNDVWPLIDREVRSVYYSTLIAERYCDCDAKLFLRRYRTICTDGSMGNYRFDPFAQMELPAESMLLERFGLGKADRWNWHAISRPYGDRKFADGKEYQDWLVSYLRNDVAEANRGNVRGPLKAALDTLRDLRNEVRLVVDHGGLSGDSYRDDLRAWYTPLNAFVSIGPPMRRIQELIALIEGGVVQVVGPGMVVDRPVDRQGFLVRSTKVQGPGLRASALIEARLPEPDIRTTTDLLLGGLLARGECALHRIPIRDGGYYETGGLAVMSCPYNLLGVSRQPHPRRFAFGVPTETVHWLTAAGIRPGVSSVIMADADAVARASFAVANSQWPQDLLAVAGL
jgi:L-aspartate N-monooxygenase (nitrosuccinate-forming)